MSFSSLVDPIWLVSGGVATSFALNLILFGFFLRRCNLHDREQQGRETEEKQALLNRMDVRLEAFERNMEKRHDELQQLLAAIELDRNRPSPPERRASPIRPALGLDKKRRVWALANRGMDPQSIAERLNMYCGETELVLGLKQFQSGNTFTSKAS